MRFSQAIWENIKKSYAVPNVPKIHQLKAEIASCKQGNLKVVEFFSKLMRLWNELGNYVKNPVCTCKAATTYAKITEDNKVHEFLMGLDDDMYANVRSQILALDSLPFLDKIFSMVQQEENHKRVMAKRDQRHEQASAFAVSYFPKSEQYRAYKVSCRHYGKT